MEGNQSNACHVLFHYNSIIAEIRAQKRLSPFPSLKKMIDLMLSKLYPYKAEALLCHSTVLATILNPQYRLKFFEDKYSSKLDCVSDLLNERLAELPEPESSGLASEPATEVENQPSNLFKSYNAFAQKSSPPATVDIELDAYLKGKFPCDPGMDHLTWWKVSFFFSSLYIVILS